MAAASSRLFFSSLLYQRPINLFRLARRNNIITFTFTTLSAAPTRHLHLTRQNSLIPINFSASFYSRGTNYAFQENNHVSANGYHAPPSHPWPEWSRLVQTLSIVGYLNGNNNIEDEFMANENLSKEFVAAANSCLAFARDRREILGWLPMKDIDVIINNGYPFLFKNAHETERRLRSFLQGSNEATSVDLMKYILSYASNPGRSINEATESSVRIMLQEIGNLANRDRVSEQNEQTPRNLGPNITMKRGDWICPKCNFMNFARNTKCLECEDPRPQIQRTDGEWDCPRCNFFNYRKNTVCLKCECSRPDAASLNGSNSGYIPSKHTQDSDKEDKTQRWFKKVKELHGVTAPDNDISNNIPQITPIHEEENRGLYYKGKDNQQQPNSTYSTIKPRNENDKNFVQETRNPFRINEPKRETLTAGQQAPESMNGKGGWSGKSLEGSAVTEPDPLDISEEAKAERWFKRVAQIKDISELSQIPDEDFPSIMPMRKGVNRFVVSKRKTPLERRLTSPQYRKNLRVMSSDPMKKEGNNNDD